MIGRKSAVYPLLHAEPSGSKSRLPPVIGFDVGWLSHVRGGATAAAAPDAWT